MTLVLDADLELLIQEKVKAGVYPSVEAMVRAGITRLLEEEEFAPGELDALVKVGIDELDRGEGLDGTQVFEELRRLSDAARARRLP